MIDDYVYLSSFYERLLDDLSNNLNKFHNKKFSKKILANFIGPLVSLFYSNSFDRYENIKTVLKNYKIKTFYDLDYSNIEFIPNNIEEFLYFINTDIWDQKIFRYC